MLRNLNRAVLRAFRSAMLPKIEVIAPPSQNQAAGRMLRGLQPKPASSLKQPLLEIYE